MEELIMTQETIDLAQEIYENSERSAADILKSAEDLSFILNKYKESLNQRTIGILKREIKNLMTEYDYIHSDESPKELYSKNQGTGIYIKS